LYFTAQLGQSTLPATIQPTFCAACSISSRFAPFRLPQRGEKCFMGPDG